MDQTSQMSPDALTVIGIDTGKDVFHLVGFGRDGKIAFRKIRRLALTGTFKKLSPCIVGMEACLSAHVIAQTPHGLGHEPRFIPAIDVKPFSKEQKNDCSDAEAIAEAALRPNLRVVREKTHDELGCRPITASARGWSRDVPPRSIRSGRSWWLEKGSAERRLPCCPLPRNGRPDARNVPRLLLPS